MAYVKEKDIFDQIEYFLIRILLLILLLLAAYKLVQQEIHGASIINSRPFISSTQRAQIVTELYLILRRETSCEKAS